MYEMFSLCRQILFSVLQFEHSEGHLHHRSLCPQYAAAFMIATLGIQAVVGSEGHGFGVLAADPFYTRLAG